MEGGLSCFQILEYSHQSIYAAGFRIRLGLNHESQLLCQKRQLAVLVFRALSDRLRLDVLCLSHDSAHFGQRLLIVDARLFEIILVPRTVRTGTLGGVSAVIGSRTCCLAIAIALEVAKCDLKMLHGLPFANTPSSYG